MVLFYLLLIDLVQYRVSLFLLEPKACVGTFNLHRKKQNILVAKIADLNLAQLLCW